MFSEPAAAGPDREVNLITQMAFLLANGTAKEKQVL
jgi:hypothetical protein